MSLNRRDFIELGTTASLLTALGWPALAADAPTVGLIFPPADYPIPPDAGRLYPSGVRFIGNGLGFNGMTIESYNEAIPRAMPRAQELAAQGANLISVFGSSITFYKGAAFNQELTDKVTALTGLPATTQSNGLVDGLKHVNAKRVAVATAYTDIVTERLEDLPHRARLRGPVRRKAWGSSVFPKAAARPRSCTSSASKPTRPPAPNPMRS